MEISHVRSGSGHPAPPLSSLGVWKQPAMGSLVLTRLYNSFWLTEKRVGKKEEKKRERRAEVFHCPLITLQLLQHSVGPPAVYCWTSNTCCLFVTTCQLKLGGGCVSAACQRYANTKSTHERRVGLMENLWIEQKWTTRYFRGRQHVLCVRPDMLSTSSTTSRRH